MGVVLDTSVLTAAERQKLNLGSFAAANEDRSFFLTAITAAEFLHGVERAHPATRRAKLSAFAEKLFASIPIHDYDLAVARRQATLWGTLATAGNLLGPYDLIIAASALEYGHSLATLNVGEFSWGPGLWLVELTAYLDT